MLKKGLIEVVQDCINSDEMRGKYRRGVEQHPAARDYEIDLG
jgi:hypothetical protein